MAGLDPISPYLALIDRIISLIQAGKTRRRDYFEKIVDPLYTQFLPLGEDTLALFRKARLACQQHKKHKKSSFEAIREHRDQFEDARHRLRALLEASKKNAIKRKDDDLAGFIESMTKFFHPRDLRSFSGTAGSSLVYLFSIWADDDRSHPLQHLMVAEKSLSDETLSNMITAVTADLEKSWYEISGRYMELKIKNTVD